MEEVVEKVKKLPEGAVEFSDNFWFQTYLSWVISFYDYYVKPTLGYWIEQNRLQEFYQWLEYFNDTILIPETNEVLFQLDSDWRVIAFILFGKRFPDESHISVLCMSTHIQFSNQRRAKALLSLAAERIKEIGIQSVRIWPIEVQKWESQLWNTWKWALCVNRILQNSWLNIID